MQKPMHYLLIYLIWFFSAWCEIYLWYLWKRFIFNESPGDSQERQAWHNSVVEVSYTYIYLINWVSIYKWACQLSRNKSKEIESLRNIFIKSHLSFLKNQLCSLNARFVMCAIYHQRHLNKTESLKDVLCWKRSCMTS